MDVWEVTVFQDDGQVKTYRFKDRSDVMHSIDLAWYKVPSSKYQVCATEDTIVVRIRADIKLKAQRITLDVLTRPTHF